MESDCHVIKRIVNPHLLSHMAPCNAASTIYQSLAGGVGGNKRGAGDGGGASGAVTKRAKVEKDVRPSGHLMVWTDG